LPIVAGKAAHVRGACGVLAADLAEPSLTVNLGKCQGGNEGRRDSLLRMSARVSGLTKDLHFPALRSHGPDRPVRGGSAVEVESVFRITQVCRFHVARSP